MKSLANNILSKAQEYHIIQIGILGFWTLFWLFNVIDKFIGGSHYLWVGRDRFAQLFKFFSSIGVDNEVVVMIVLLIVTIIEIVALVFVIQAFIQYLQKNTPVARTLLFWGTFAGLILFTLFAIGDQVFGDRFELLEHSLFWILLIVSWQVYIQSDNTEKRITKETHVCYRKTFLVTLILCVVFSIGAAFSLMEYNKHHIAELQTVVVPEDIGAGVYKFELPFLANRSVWERSLIEFLNSNPQLSVVTTYVLPSQLKSKADNVIIHIVTQPK